MRLRCNLCGHESSDFEQALSHLKEEHPAFCNVKEPKEILMDTLDDGTDTFEVEALAQDEDEEEDEDQDEDEVKPKKREYPYPEDPYYTDGQDEFSCKTCPFKGNIQGFIKHLMETHPEDAEKVIKHFLRQGIIKKHAGHSKTEPLSDEQVSRWADQEFEELWLNLKLQSKDTLAQWMEDTSLPVMKDFLTGKRDICALCGLTQGEFYAPDRLTRYQHEVIISAIRKENPSLQNLNINDFGKVAFSGKWKGHPVSLKFLNVLHLALKHPEQFHELIPQNLTGNLPLFLASFSAKPSKTELSVFSKEIKAAKDGMVQEYKNYLAWLNPKRKQ